MRKLILNFILFGVLLISSLEAQNKKKTENSNYGATIEKNLEAYTLLERAKVFLESKKYQDAVLLLKVIGEKYPNALITSEDNFYLPFRDKILEIVKSLPPEAKALFMLEINSISLGLFNKGIEEMDELIFEEIYQKYYLSNLGDDVANQLGLIALEKGNFIKSINYFEKTLSHPQCSINKEKVKLCLYYLYKVTLNESKAKVIFKQLNEISSMKDNLIKSDLAISELLKSKNDIKIEPNNFTHLNKEFWTTVWKQEYELTSKANNEYVQNQRIRRLRNRGNITIDSENNFDEDTFSNEWKKNFWYPVNNSVVTDKHIVFRKNDQLTCYALENQKKILWEANLEVGGKSANRGFDRENYGNTTETRVPSSRDEILAFSDQIGKLMAEKNGVLFAISNHEKTGQITPFYQKRWGNNNSNEKHEGNFIFAIDIKSGKKLWKLGEIVKKTDPFYNAVFLHLPIETPYGYFVTFQSNSDLYCATISKQRELIWKSYLCSAESSSEMTTNNAGAAFGDDFIYITVDYGVVIKINAADGKYCWIKRYNSASKLNSNLNYSGPSIKDGIEVNSIIYNLGRLVLLPSDMMSIIILDADNGDELHVIEDSFAEYCRYLLGFDDSGFYMAGSKGVRKYLYDTKEFKWQADIKDNFGRGTIFGTKILFPSDQKIYIIDKVTGKKISNIKVKLENLKQPLGNLAFSAGYILSTDYNSVSVLNEVDLLITVLTESIAQNKTDELLHKRGTLYSEKGDYKKAFGDISEAIALSASNSEKNILYCESLLDLFEKIHELGDAKEYQNTILEMSKYFTDSNHKSLLYFLQAEIFNLNKNYDDACKNYILSFSQSNSPAKQREVKSENMISSPGFASILNVSALVKQNLISEEKLIEYLDSPGVTPDEFNLLTLLEKIPSNIFKKWVFKYYLKKCSNDFGTSIAKSFLFCLSNSDDPDISLSAKYYLFQQNIQMKEYWSAGHVLETLQSQKPEAVIYTQNGLELLTSKIGQYKINKENMLDLLNPSVRQIMDPPLNELWSTKSLDPNAKVLQFMGISFRPEFVEKNIFIRNRVDNKIFSCDILSGEKKWVLDLPNDKNETKLNENINTGDILLRMEGVALINWNKKEWAIDLKTGKFLWNIALEKSDSVDMSSGCLLRQKPKELTVIDAFTGKKLYTLTFIDDFRKAYAYKGRLVVINLGSTAISLYNLYSGEKIKELSFNTSLKENVNLFLGDSLIVQENEYDLIAYSLRKGEVLWKNKFNAYPIRENIFNIKDKNILMYGSDNKIYYLSGDDGKVIWKYEIPDRYLYRTVDMCPVSGNDTVLFLASSQVKQENNIATSQDFYFIFDMQKGTLINKITADISSQEAWRPRFAWGFAFKGDVLPKIIYSNNNAGSIKFIRKRDGGITKKFSIELKQNSDLEVVTVKGQVLFVIGQNELTAYGNKELIESQNKKIKILAESFNEK
jgi:outer membrane protein assembly factor BamB